MPLHHSLLTGIAMGDGKTSTAFKRANVSQEVGLNAIDELCESGIIKLEKSKAIFTSWEENESVANKLFFASAFLRFWFAFVSPIFKGIRDGDYKEIRERYANRENEFVQLPFTQLTHEFLKINFKDSDPIVEISTYWDNNIELDIYAKTASGKTIVGSCKYSNTKIKKSELTRIQEKCEEAKISPDIIVIMSKRGFSNELKTLKSDTLKLLSVKSFKQLL